MTFSVLPRIQTQLIRSPVFKPVVYATLFGESQNPLIDESRFISAPPPGHRPLLRSQTELDQQHNEAMRILNYLWDNQDNIKVVQPILVGGKNHGSAMLSLHGVPITMKIQLWVGPFRKHPEHASCQLIFGEHQKQMFIYTHPRTPVFAPPGSEHYPGLTLSDQQKQNASNGAYNFQTHLKDIQNAARHDRTVDIPTEYNKMQETATLAHRIYTEVLLAKLGLVPTDE